MAKRGKGQECRQLLHQARVDWFLDLSHSRHALGGRPFYTTSNWLMEFMARHADGGRQMGNKQVPIHGGHPWDSWHALGGQQMLMFTNRFRF